MRIAISALLGAGVLAMAGPAMAADEAPKAPEATDMTITCGAPLAWDATEESLKAQFGAENVEYLDLGGPEGTELFGTRVFAKDAKKTFSVLWADEDKRANPSSVEISQVWSEDGESVTNPEWASGDGVKVGMSIEEVEKINGKPFKLSGFGWDYGGNALNWDGGKLQPADDAKCGIAVSFNQTAEEPAESTYGDKEIVSNDKDVVASKPVVWRYSVYYVRPDAEETPTP